MLKKFLVVIFGKNPLERGIGELHRVSSKSHQRMTSPETGAFLQDARSNSNNSDNGDFRELQIHLSYPGDIRVLIFTTTIFVTLDFLDYYRGERIGLGQVNEDQKLTVLTSIQPFFFFLVHL